MKPTTIISGMIRNSRPISYNIDRKNCIREKSEQLVTRKRWNPRPARMKSARGISFNKHEARVSMLIQLLPVALLAAFLISKIVF